MFILFFSIQRNDCLCRILFNNTIIFGLIFFKSLFLLWKMIYRIR